MPDGWNVHYLPRGSGWTAQERNQRVRAALVSLSRSFDGLLDAVQFLNRKDHDLGNAVNAINDNIDITGDALVRLGIIKDWQ